MTKRVKYNGELHNIDSPEKAYLLGLIYSDGCVLHKKSYFHDIVLHEDDLYLLEKIRKLFPFYTLRKHSTHAYELYCCQKECYKDLLLHNILERKSTTNKERTSFPSLDSSLYSHFIRGYFDGDGSVFKQKVGNTKIEIGSTSFKMITDIIKILYDHKITVNLRCRYVGESLRKHDFYILYTSSDKISKQFADFIYQDCGDLYMKRKYDKLYYIPKYNKKQRLICPICNSSNTTYNGLRPMKNHVMQRGCCNNCGRRFSIKLTAPLDSNIQSGEDELLEA